jgi:hypothetical protein
MAKGSEHRMVFDLRGRRKRVVQVVYAMLAALMALSLLTVVGPVSLGDIFGGGSGSSNPASALDDQAVTIEKRLKKDPENEALLLSLVRTRYSAGNAQVIVDPSTGQQSISPEARVEYEKAAAAWSKYLNAVTGQPSPNVAQQASTALFTLAATSATAAEAQTNLEDAAKAEAIVAKARPSVGSLSTLAYYSYYALNFKQGDAAAKQAQAKASSKAQARSIETQLAAIRKRAKSFQKQQQQAAAQGGKKQGQEQLENPLGGLSGGGLGAPSP